MTTLQKTKDVLSLIIAGASTLVALADLWTKVGPEFKKVVSPFMEKCRKVANSDIGSEIDTIEKNLMN